MKEFLQSAEKILVPKGTDNKSSRDAFEKVADIEIPSFKGEELFARSEGREFWLVKSRDMPWLIANGWGDVGVTASDVVTNYQIEGTNRLTLKARTLGNEAICRFSLLCYEDQQDEMKKLLWGNSGEWIRAVTAQPKLLTEVVRPNERLRIAPEEVPVSGSVEGVMRLVGARAAADIVASGETARQNGLAELLTLMKIYPEVVFRRSEGEQL